MPQGIAWDLQLLSGGFAAAIGLFCIGVWTGRRLYPNLLVFLTIGFGLLWTWNLFTPPWHPQPSGPWRDWFAHGCMLWQVAAAHFYMAFLHGQRRRWIAAGQFTQTSRLRAPNFWSDSPLDRALLLFCGLLPLATLPVAPWTTPAQVVAAMIGLFALGSCLAETRNALRSRNQHALAFAVAYWLALVCAFADVLRTSASDAPWLSPYTPFLLAVAMGGSLVRNLIGSRNESEALNASLERQLRAREAELAESYAKLRAAERLATLGEERRRLTQDMHDGLGSSLVSALRVVEDGRLSKAELEDVLRSCIDDLKLTIDSMEPVEADLLLLLATLRFRLEPRLTSAGVALRWDIVDVPKLDWLDPRNALHILRILQEAFANVLKHTRATEIRVTTGAAQGWVSVTITDNGGGFDVAAARRGKGLDNQQRRAAAIGAGLALDSSAAGTRLTLRLPEVRKPT